MDTCLRQVANWSVLKPAHKFDKATWDAAQMAAELPYASPKLEALLDNIARLDAADMRWDGRLYKHFIFSDVKYGYGAKLVVGGLLTRGFHMVFDKRFEIGAADADGKAGPGTGVAVLVSTTLFGDDVPARFRKKLLTAFNKRPDNVHGDHIRIIVLDSGFKEGIDLYDVKYAHIFEPPVTAGDKKQVVGRATRFCGQAGLHFVPGEGWTLQVFTYDTVVPAGVEGPLVDALGGKRSLFDAFLAVSKMDTKSLRFNEELTELIRGSAVDVELTAAVHGWGQVGGRVRKGARTGKKEKKVDKDVKDGKKTAKAKKKVAKPVKVIKPRLSQPLPPSRIMNRNDMSAWVRERFARFKWPAPVAENGCEDPTATSGRQTATMATLTPTQDFVRNFFTPTSAYKGLLLYHGVGTGKTCCAIATATSSFEREGYSILWVTRTTLKTDLWKNMFQKVCSMTVKERKQPIDVADALARPMSYLSKEWLPPISFKSFSNMLAGKNELYHTMVKRNGSSDILRKTLVIIDEAHKLYDGTLPVQERPDSATMMQRFQQSYKVSGKDSVRLLLMSATPWTRDAMDFIKLINLMREESTGLLPSGFDAFSSEYLDDGGGFTGTGAEKFMDQMSGYVSYLNREKDVRQFARPVFARVNVPLSLDALTAVRAKIEKMERALERLEAQHAEQVQLYEKATAKLAKETAAWKRSCERVRLPDRRAMCDAQVAERVQEHEEGYILPLREAMDKHAERIAQAKDAIEAEREALKKHPSRLLSQERAVLKCAGVEIIDETPSKATSS